MSIHVLKIQQLDVEHIQVTNGQGIDRHLLGLKLIAQEAGLPVPDLLKDPVYESTCYWKISTSQVAI